MVIPILVVLGIDVFLNGAVVEEREVSYTLPFIHGKIGNGDMGILVFQCIYGQIVGKFLMCARKRYDIMMGGEMLEGYIRERYLR
ncbi:MAG TPA: hypothetical protein PK739_10205 [Methanoculleus sp.]|nr:hypothetical protein [Methanoculleus sp.]